MVTMTAFRPLRRLSPGSFARSWTEGARIGRYRSRQISLPRRIATLGAVLACTVAAAGCGGGDDDSSSSDSETTAESSDETMPLDDWVDGVCTAVLTWSDTVTTATQDLGNPETLSAETFNEAATATADATRTLADDVSVLGPPDTEAGAEAQEELSTLSDNVSAEVDTLSDATSDESSTPDDLVAQLDTISQALTGIGSEVETSLETIGELDGADELKDAVASSTTCQQVGATG